MDKEWIYIMDDGAGHDFMDPSNGQDRVDGMPKDGTIIGRKGCD
jgi:hypothetical protein